MQEIDKSTLKTQLAQSNMNPLWIPQDFIQVDSIPKLGTGKIDLKAAKKQLSDLIIFSKN